MDVEMDEDLDLDLDCLFEFDSPIDTGEINTAASSGKSPNERAFVRTGTGRYELLSSMLLKS